MALKSLLMIIEYLLQIELSFNNKTKIICQIIFSMYKLDMWLIKFMHGKYKKIISDIFFCFIRALFVLVFIC